MKKQPFAIVTRTAAAGIIAALFFATLFSACGRKDNYSAYLFAYFVGNGPGQEAIHFAVSPDGYNYLALNGNKAVISADTISARGGVRDPHILRGRDGYFYMTVTDLYVPKDGWTNIGMVFLKSKNLIDWSYSQVNIPELFPKFADVRRVWAPQTFYDAEAGKYMVYFSMMQPGGSDIIYYAYANKEFTSLETEPKQLFFHPESKSCIDGDIVFKDGKYNLFFKTEGSGNGIKKAVSDNLTEGYVLIDKYLQQTRNAVEGSCLFKLNNSDTYILMYDVYTRGTYQFTQSTDLDSFAVIDESISMNFHPRHGTIVPITNKELNALVKKWSSVEELGISSVESESVRTQNVVFDAEAGTLSLPLKAGSSPIGLNPQFKSLFGAEITPADSQDFSSGPVAYQVKWKGVGETTWQVSAEVAHNPALNGYYADPEILYSEKTGKYYLYPTSDGFQGWSGTYFKTFSSPDLVNWTDEGVILDLPRDVAWGRRNAWAPTILENKTGDSFKYYYYFTAAQKIGVAVSDNPTGPFVDSGAPLVASKPEGIRGGQEIDPDVFRDPVSGNCFLYWGNGYLAAVPLNPDLVSFNQKKVKILTPDRTFREGTEVFYRNGIYYFLWSDNDTRSPDYRVRYATAPSPMGPLTIPENNLILSKNPDMGIYGTGHNCVLQIPGRDEWYVVYHRFTRPKGIEMGESAGYNREVCIDKLTFNADGSIQPVIPTVTGIAPLQ